MITQAHPISAPTVSIVTVCRNAASTIGATLASVRAQSHTAIQHIVVDGASNDGTQHIVSDNLRSGGILLSEPDSGIYNAMNKGLALATGDIVAFLNADDAYADADVIARVCTLFSEGGINAVFGDVAFFRDANFTQLVRRYDSGQFHPGRIRWGWMPAHPGMFVSRDVYTALDGFAEDYRIAGDFDFVVRAFRDGLIQYRHLPEIFVNMQMGGASTRDFSAKMRINKEVVRACRRNGVYSNLLMVMSKYPLKLLEIRR